MPPNPFIHPQQFYFTQLQSFLNSPVPFRILHSISSSPSSPTQTQPATQKLYILDSSFNPPTLAHLHICLSALLSHTSNFHTSPSNPSTPRLLLLLSTLNADKGTGATNTTLCQRLVGIEIFAHDLLAAYKAQYLSSSSESQAQGDAESRNPTPEQDLGIDIGLIKYPYFHDKALAISESGFYTNAKADENGTEKEKEEGNKKEVMQVHLTGFDTLIRVLNPKYYDPKDLSHLIPFLGRHRLRVAWRDEEAEEDGKGDDGKWSRKKQEEWVQGMKRKVGEMGGKEEWWGGVDGETKEKGGIEMVDVGKEGVGISSSRVRSVVAEKWAKEGGEGPRDALKELVSEWVGEWIVREGLYKDG